MGTGKITAAMTLEGALEGATDRDAFDVFVTHGLVPTLRPGQTVITVIWDNLSVHQSAKAIAAIEAAGCRVVFLPPYSPDVAPIEPAFGTLKTVLRRCGGPGREPGRPSTTP